MLKMVGMAVIRILAEVNNNSNKLRKP